MGAQQAARSLPPDEYRVVTRAFSPSPDVASIRVRTDLVLLRVVVSNRSGKAVTGLTQGDFELRDSGKPTAISIFREITPGGQEAGPSKPLRMAAETPVPVSNQSRYIALFFDDRNLPLSDLVAARDAAATFLKKQMMASDHVALFTSSAPFQGTGFTTDSGMILERIGQLRTQARRADDGLGACPPIGPLLAFQIARANDREALDLGIAMAQACPGGSFTSRRDLAAIVQRQADFVLSVAEQFSVETMAAVAHAIESLGNMPGERVLVLASSGFWSRSLQREQAKLSDLALQREVVINALDARGVIPDGANAAAPIALGRRPELRAVADRFAAQQRDALSDVLASLSQSTGGIFFQNNNDLRQGMVRLAAPPDSSYLLGFEPLDLTPNGRFHQVDVKIRKEGATSIRHRPGYFAPTPEPATTRGKGDPFETAVRSGQSLADIGIAVADERVTTDSSEAALHVAIRIDLRGLPFQKRLDRRVQRMRYAVSVFSSDGAFLAGQQAVIYLSLKPESYLRLAREGLEQKLVINLPQGKYRLRHVLQEAIEGKMAAMSRDVTIP